MACNNCETIFLGNQTIEVRVEKSGTDAFLKVINNGHNPVLICRIFVCSTKLNGQGSSMFALRPPPEPISWEFPKAIVEPGLLAHFFTLKNVAPGTIIQAQAQYVEFAQRGQSCPTTF